LIAVPLTVPEARYSARDFVPLGQAVRSYWTLSVPSGGPYGDFAGYAAAAKRDPLLRSYGVPLLGGGPTVIGDAIGKQLGVHMVPVPFSGSAPVISNVMAGQVPAGITGMPEAMAVHRSGKARIVAVSGATRSALLPQVPTFRELGIEGLEFHTFMGFFAPKGLPAPMVQAFNAALRKSLADPAVLEQIRQMSLQAAPTSLEEARVEVEQTERFWKTALSVSR
jgi:tripartite-type tricarboxylate transporter receptor subunit TctC